MATATYKKLHCPECDTQLKIEIKATSIEERWYCPSCKEEKTRARVK